MPLVKIRPLGGWKQTLIVGSAGAGKVKIRPLGGWKLRFVDCIGFISSVSLKSDLLEDGN